MWIFTRRGMIAIVQHPDDPDSLIVRARRIPHLEDLFPGAKIYRVSATKYRWRAVVSREEVSRVIAEKLTAINYPAFRMSITDADYFDVCERVAYDTALLQSPFSPFEQAMRDELLAEQEEKKRRR